MSPALQSIRQIGQHTGKNIVFGYDRYLLPELEAYTRAMALYGNPIPSIDFENPHYLTSAERVCQKMRFRADHVGVLICSTGMGVSIAANKFRGVYAGRCLSVEDAQMARTINNANVLCLSSKLGLELNEKIIHAFMTTPYEGRKLEQLEYISSMEIESDMYYPTAQPALQVVR